MDFFGIGISELFVIIIFMLLFFKPEEIPTIIRKAIDGLKKIRTFSSNVKDEMNNIYEDQIRPYTEDIKNEVKTHFDAIEATKHDFKKDIQASTKAFETATEELKKEQEEIKEIIQSNDETKPL